MNLINLLVQNKHTSGAALVFAGLKGGKHIALAWAPNYADKITLTVDVLEGLAVLYMGGAAGDAIKSASKQDVQQVRQDLDTATFRNPNFIAPPLQPPSQSPPNPPAK